MIKSRLPDVRFLLDQMLAGDRLGLYVDIDTNGLDWVVHSFGGWTVLAGPDSERRVQAVVALAPGGASRRKNGYCPFH